jgi:DNA-binding MarR family transcriptional regulator
MVSDIEERQAPSAGSRAELEQEISQLMRVVPSVIKLLKERADVAVTRGASGSEEGQYKKATADLGLSQMKVLGVLANDECVMSDLARRFNVSGPTITHVVDALVERGYVERRRDGEDRRCIYLTLTEMGQEAWRLMSRRYTAALKEFLRPLSDEQLETVVLAGKYLGELLERQSEAADLATHMRTPHLHH